MEYFEENDFLETEESPAAPENTESTPAKKASPFADSPYVVYEEPASNGSTCPSPKKEKKHGNFGRAILSGLLILALVAGSCGLTAVALNGYWQAVYEEETERLEDVIDDLRQEIKDNSYTGNGNSISGTPNYSENGLTPAKIFAENYKSVVYISATVNPSTPWESTSSSSGSGFIISKDGYIVTNYHVVENAASLTVVIHNGAEYSATYVGGDSATDLAVIKVDTTDLQTVKIGSSDDLIVGDQVVAIGYPVFAEAPTLTVGYVSTIDRDVNTTGALMDMIQTDAAINPGNSGGPLFNMKGEVVGITAAKISGTTNSGASIEGIGFAIPIDDVIKKIEDLRDIGYISGAYLGVMVKDTDSSLSYYGIPAGAYVSEVTPGYCAEKAGIKAKDIIIALGKYEVEGLNDLTKALQNFEANEETVVTVWRAGQQLELPITLDERPAETP